ncbi:hypothetical protein Emag_006755 [Eimeria magna]
MCGCSEAAAEDRDVQHAMISNRNSAEVLKQTAAATVTAAKVEAVGAAAAAVTAAPAAKREQQKQQLQLQPQAGATKMAGDFIIGCVGKSTFFNAATEGSSAKVGSYPFTTITPNEGIAYFATQCPCKKYGVKCSPRYGRCVSGRRSIPVRLLDVAGLIPGANEGRGLGCKFLDDLRLAHVLLHIIDISGTTNEKASD